MSFPVSPGMRLALAEILFRSLASVRRVLGLATRIKMKPTFKNQIVQNLQLNICSAKFAIIILNAQVHHKNVIYYRYSLVAKNGLLEGILIDI